MKIVYGVLALILLTSTCSQEYNTLETPVSEGFEMCFSTDSNGIMLLDGYSIHSDSLLAYITGNLWKEISMITIDPDGRIPETPELYLGYKGNHLFWVKDKNEVRFFYDCSSIIEGTYYNEKYLYEDVKVTVGKDGLVQNQEGTSLYRLLFISENTLQIIDRNRHLITFEKRPGSEVSSYNDNYKTHLANATRMFSGKFESGSSNIFSFDGNGIPFISGYHMSYEYFRNFFGFCWRHHVDHQIQKDGSLDNPQEIESEEYLLFDINRHVSICNVRQKYEIQSIHKYRHDHDCTLYSDKGQFTGRALNCDLNSLSIVLPAEKSESGYKLSIYHRIYDDHVAARLKALIETYQILSKPMSENDIVHFSIIDNGTPILSANKIDRQKYFEILIADGRIWERSSIVCMIGTDGHPDYKIDWLEMKQNSYRFTSYREDGVIKDNSGKMIMQIIYLHPDYIQVIENLNNDLSQSPLWVVTTYE